MEVVVVKVAVVVVVVLLVTVKAIITRLYTVFTVVQPGDKRFNGNSRQ